MVKYSNFQRFSGLGSISPKSIDFIRLLTSIASMVIWSSSIHVVNIEDWRVGYVLFIQSFNICYVDLKWWSTLLRIDWDSNLTLPNWSIGNWFKLYSDCGIRSTKNSRRWWLFWVWWTNREDYTTVGITLFNVYHITQSVEALFLLFYLFLNQRKQIHKIHCTLESSGYVYNDCRKNPCPKRRK